MAHFKRKSKIVEAFDFDEFVAFGLTAKDVNIVEGMPWHFTFKEHAVTHENNDLYIVPIQDAHDKFSRNDIIFVDEEGKLMILHKDQFAALYEPMKMDFGAAIQALKQGRKVAREGWNGKGMFLYHVPAASYPAVTEIAKQTFPDGMVPYGAYIAMKTAQQNVVPWLASQTDVLSEDWEIVE